MHMSQVESLVWHVNAALRSKPQPTPLRESSGRDRDQELRVRVRKHYIALVLYSPG